MSGSPSACHRGLHMSVNKPLIWVIGYVIFRGMFTSCRFWLKKKKILIILYFCFFIVFTLYF